MTLIKTNSLEKGYQCAFCSKTSKVKVVGEQLICQVCGFVGWFFRCSSGCFCFWWSSISRDWWLCVSRRDSRHRVCSCLCAMMGYLWFWNLVERLVRALVLSSLTWTSRLDTLGWVFAMFATTVILRVRSTC